MSALREIIAMFKIDVEAEELEKAGKKVSGFVDYLKTMGPILAGAFAIRGITEFVGETIEAGARIVDLSNRLGIGTQELQQWQFAARTAGVEAESAAHSLGLLNKAVGEAVLGGKEQSQAFQKLGVSLATLKSGDTGEILGEVADGIAKLQTQPERAAYAVKLFGREGQQLLPILANGREGLGKLNEEFEELGGGMSKEFVQNAKKADDALAGLRVGMQSLKARIVGALLPALEAFTTKVKGWIKAGADWFDHTTLLTHGLKLLAIASGVKLTTTLVKLAKVFGLLQPSIWGSVKALLGFAAPILIVGIFILLIEDLWTAIEGGDSVIGDMLVQLGGLEGKDQFIQELKDAWDELKISLGDISWGDAIGGTIKFIVGAMYELVEAAKLVVHTLKTVGDAGGNGVSWLVGKLTGDKGQADSAASSLGRDFDKDSGKVAGDVDAMWNPAQHWKNHPAATTVPTAPGAVPGPEADKGGGQTSIGAITYGAPKVAPAAGHTVNQKNEINVTVQGSKDAKATGRSVGQGAASVLEQEHYNAAMALETQ